MMVSSGIKYTTWCLRRFYSLQNLILGRETFAIRFTNISNLCIDQKAPHTSGSSLSFQYKNSSIDKPSIISCKTTSKVSNLVNYSINIQRNVFDGKRGKRIRLCAVPTNHKYNLLMSCIIWTKNYITLHGHIKIFFHYTLKCVKYKSIFNADFTLHR